MTEMAVIHMSNYPSHDRGEVKTIDHDVSHPVALPGACETLEKMWVAMEAHPEATVTDYTNHGQYGSSMDYLDEDGIRWHVWVDTPDTAEAPS